MKKSAKIATALVFVLSIGIAFNSPAQTGNHQKKAIKTTQATKKLSTAESKASKKSSLPTTDTEIGKGKKRDCQLDFDSYVGYYINIYTDGHFQGTISPYGRSSVYPFDGYTAWYAETAGGTYFWNGNSNCNEDNHIKLQ
ncbi:MAG: hypothetical protein V4543_01475 [Bacteroidota bacterium]